MLTAEEIRFKTPLPQIFPQKDNKGVTTEKLLHPHQADYLICSLTFAALPTLSLR
jgi:hypothetical protein